MLTDSKPEVLDLDFSVKNFDQANQIMKDVWNMSRDEQRFGKDSDREFQSMLSNYTSLVMKEFREVNELIARLDFLKHFLEYIRLRLVKKSFMYLWMTVRTIDEDDHYSKDPIRNLSFAVAHRKSNLRKRYFNFLQEVKEQVESRRRLKQL